MGLQYKVESHFVVIVGTLINFQLCELTWFQLIFNFNKCNSKFEFFTNTQSILYGHIVHSSILYMPPHSFIQIHPFVYIPSHLLYKVHQHNWALVQLPQHTQSSQLFWPTSLAILPNLTYIGSKLDIGRQVGR